VTRRRSGGRPLAPLEFDSSDDGLIAVPLVSGMTDELRVTDRRYFTAIGPYLLGTAPESSSPAYRNFSPDEALPISLWRGTLVTGRLVRPDGSAAPNTPLKVGVYINNQLWKKRLRMDQTFYSWDHGEWPNWLRTVVTDREGRFEATVPPPDARSWVRVGTGSLGFSAINDTELPSKASSSVVSELAPFERDFSLDLEPGGHLEGTGYGPEGNVRQPGRNLSQSRLETRREPAMDGPGPGDGQARPSPGRREDRRAHGHGNFDRRGPDHDARERALPELRFGPGMRSRDGISLQAAVLFAHTDRTAG
jgi:hypothetical protein